MAGYDDNAAVKRLQEWDRHFAKEREKQARMSKASDSYLREMLENREACIEQLEGEKAVLQNRIEELEQALDQAADEIE